MTDTTSHMFFERKYLDDHDPWKFASSEYELGRYGATCKALDHRRYGRAFEPGCSIGILTARLAAICDQVEAMDFSPTAVTQAAERCKGLPNVDIVCGALPEAIPTGMFDLIVLSEIGYYFQEENLLDLLTNLTVHLRNSGTLLAVHWLGTSEDHLLSGDRVHELMGGLVGLTHEYGQRYSGFRLDRWRRT